LPAGQNACGIAESRVALVVPESLTKPQAGIQAPWCPLISPTTVAFWLNVDTER